MNADLLDNDIKVFHEDNLWKVKTAGADRADQTFEDKNDAVKRAEEITKNKDSRVIIYKKDGDVQSKRRPK